ncbi:Ubiquitin carboxyl-terminal hydrolase 25 [Ancistrocladus abbreviatus]
MALQMSWQSSLLQQKRKNGPPLGLRNLGNSCYLNSVLQCLTYTPPLANFCLKNQHSSLCDSASQPDKKRDCPFCILEKRIVRSLSIDQALDSPAKIVSCLRIFAEHFRCGRQEDAHEFLRYVIDACHNTCLKLKKLQQQRRKAGNGGEEGSNGNTIVKEIFGGALQSQVKCLSCGAESNKVDEIMDISLDILHGSSLKEAMQKFFQPEILDGSNKYNCEKCKKLVRARKQMSILQAPNVLVIQLKRFGGIFGGKIDKAIAFEQILVLSSFMSKASKDPCPEYNLFGTIVHSGSSPESGHYYAYIKDGTGKWYCCNDSYVTISSVTEVLSEKVYILFFTRTNQRPITAHPSFVSNGVKSHGSNGSQKNGVVHHDCKGSETIRSSDYAFPLKPVNEKLFNESSLGKGISVGTKVNGSSPSLQTKFSSLSSSLAKRVCGSSNGNVDAHKSQGLERKGVVDESVCKERSEKKLTPSATRNNSSRSGKHNAEGENCDSVANGSNYVRCQVDDAMKADVLQDSLARGKATGKMTHYNTACNVGGNGEVDSSASMRKVGDRDPCVLLAKDSHSRERVEEFKEVLRKEALLVLQRCSWSDEVHKYMRSRKRMHMDDHALQNETDSKRLLVADAKATFLSQIPESLKENLIKRLRSFAQDEQS